MPLLAAALAIVLIQPGQAPTRNLALLSVSTERAAGSSRVVMKFDGPLPELAVGVAHNPPRVFVDVPGALTAPRRGAGGGPVVRRVRAAQHQAAPPVVRVVVDLTREADHTLDQTRRAQGELAIIVSDPPGLPAPPPRAPAARQPVQDGIEPRRSPRAPAARRPVQDEIERPRAARAPVARRPVQRDIERTRAADAAALERLRRFDTLLLAIDDRDEVSEHFLQTAIDEFNATRRTLSARQAPEPVAATHQALITACTLGATAAAARLESQREGDPARAWSAASAAAGARLLLEKVAADLASAPVRP